MEGSNIILFLGRFHPLLVHLPIGFLFFAVVIEITERLKITNGLKNAVPFSLLLGTLSAVAASGLGLMLATSGDYNHEALDNHKWAGIVTTLVALFAYLLSLDLSFFKAFQKQAYLVTISLIVVGLSVTGHLGGNLTHGEDYLTHYMPFKSKKEDPLARPEVTDISQAEYFADVVHPIIKAKCYSCHNASKMKGQLSFESIEAYMKGGKHGSTIVAGDADGSEIMKRVNLPEDDKLFMPPKGKTPLTDEEKAILVAWINDGKADYKVKIVDTKPTEETLGLISNFLHIDGYGANDATVAFNAVKTENLDAVIKAGFTVRELVAGSNTYDIVLLPSGEITINMQEKLKALQGVKDNVLWLSLDKSNIRDEDLDLIANFSKLERLNLANTKVTDEGLKRLGELESLKTLNVYQTKIDFDGVKAVMQLPNLKKVYVWRTGLDKDEIALLEAENHKLKFVSGL